MRTPPLTAVLSVLAVAVLVSGCTAPSDTSRVATPTPTATHGIRLVSPDGPVTLGDEVRIIVEVTNGRAPVAGAHVTFDVLSGPGIYPDGFETDTTDEAGVATSLQLHADSPGTIAVRVAADAQSKEIDITVAP
ncbi:hypothetical protein LXM50_14385 [Microbacterium sp. Au-Mic1]|uniref:hypothetical protein n=1 Tax=Microbacterium sp. Au-Mic1 TaxID=2906457 RepID=UPI001E59EFFF|nr:hypothetical protein [Microbacterium sp. Au-Mic1]MCE4027164.1 hypothetical protein [Microbacterium sp. Au-Mic1]